MILGEGGSSLIEIPRDDSLSSLKTQWRIVCDGEWQKCTSGRKKIKRKKDK